MTHECHFSNLQPCLYFETCRMFLLQLAKRNVIVTNENGKYQLTDELPNNV